MLHLPDLWIRAAVNDAAEGMLVETEGKIAFINESYARMLGYRSVHEVAGADVTSMVDARDRGRLEHFTKCRREGRPAPARYVFNGLCRDGASLGLEASVSTTRVVGQLLITTVVRPNEAASSVLPPPDLACLSPREREIFALLVGGRRPKEIALQLEISAKTVHTHTSRLYEKLALRSSLDLFRFAAHAGLLDAQIRG